MTSLSISRGTAATAAALSLAGAFAVGTAFSGDQADAAVATARSDASPWVAPRSQAPFASTEPTVGSTTGITVSTTARVAGTPDTLRLDLSVTGKAGNVTAALDRANAAAAKVHASLTRSGVARKDLQTSNLQIQPEYSYPSNGHPVLTGYTVTEGVTAKLRDLGRAGAAITAAANAGGNAVQVNGIHLDLDDTSTLATAARDKAFADARTKAAQYAKAAGRPLGAVLSVTETVSEQPPVDVAYARDAAMASKPVPILPGTQGVGVSVTVVYAFG